tara:strand:- start:207 stop:461 length:255 start_codon:yes stop_codon:yes gene_type:complete
MCLGGGAPKAPTVKPVPAPPPPAPVEPPRQAAAPRKPIEDPGITPDVQLGGANKKSNNRSSLKPQSNAGSVSPNTGTTPGALNI